MAQKAWEGMDIRTAAAADLERLAEQTGETVHLAVLDEAEVVYIDKVESSQRLRMFSAIGKRGPVHCTGVGKAMLAFLESDERDKVLERLPLQRFTNATFVTRHSLLLHLAEIRQVGYAKDLEEHEIGIRCTAAPIFDYQGKVIASVSVTAPSLRLSPERLDEIAPFVVRAAEHITRNLGGKVLKAASP
jgi:DNA-binding IclR family transcriptional regulator